MIFVTIGSQEPFDRLIKAIDEIAVDLNHPIIAQVFRPGYKVRNIQTVEFISPIQYSDYINKADLIIAHAGMGTILSVLQVAKPLIVMPRLAKYHETRNNHQIATADEFAKLGYLRIANDGDELKNQIISALAEVKRPQQKINGSASSGLITSIKDFIEGVAATA